MPTEKSCGSVLFKKKGDGSVKFLLLHYTAGHWDFPKGNQEKNETEEQTAKREIKEETGIEDIELIKGFKEAVKYFYKKGEETIYKEVVFFLAQTMDEKVKLSHEHIGYVWLSYQKAYEKLTYGTSKELLRKGDGYLQGNGDQRIRGLRD